MINSILPFYRSLRALDDVSKAKCLLIFLVFEFKKQTKYINFDEFVQRVFLTGVDDIDAKPAAGLLYWQAASQLLEHVVGVMDPVANRQFITDSGSNTDYKYAYELLAEKIERIKDYHLNNGFEADYWRIYEHLKTPKS